MKLLMKKILILLIFSVSIYSIHVSAYDYITIAILAKDKAHTLPLYLQCIENQTWPKDRTYLYIRTNNNNDNTAQILREWIEKIGYEYAGIYFDDTDVEDPVEQFGQHEWNATRFKVLGKIRQASIDWAYENDSHYFVVDCDNFISPDTIEVMFKTNLSIVAPMLMCSSNKYYSNYHHVVDDNGYYAHSDLYYTILNRDVMGLIEVAVVHCAYFIRHEFLKSICYDDASARYEYVIFSDNARKKDIPQYIDNRKVYGYISFAESEDELKQDYFFESNYFSNSLCHKTIQKI